MSRRLTGVTTRIGLFVLAALAYVPALLTKPDVLPADTKVYLYLDPGRLIGDAVRTWDTRQFGGWVPHQIIAYLWPQGPWYLVMAHLGLPTWVAHRLWIGTLLFLGASGVWWAARVLGLDRRGALAAAAVYQLSPYVLPYISRTSAMLLPWAAVGWLVGLTVRAATSERRWRYAALAALVVLSCSAVNATAVLMIAPAPVLWLLHATLARIVSWKRALAAAARIGSLSIGVSLWWIVMVSTQGKYGADVLSYSESLQATSLTSTSTETLRGMGYWLAYVRDPFAFTTTAARTYMESGRAIALSFGLVALCVAGLAVTRWSQRRYAAMLVFVGIVLGVGVHPIGDASPLMRLLAEHSRSSLSLALRSSTRALPLSNFGLALGIGALVTALAEVRLPGRWTVVRWLAPAGVVLLAVANLPALFDGGLVDPALARQQDPPTAWVQAANALSATSSEYRVMQLPGSEFGAFRWGYTVDPPLPGMTTKPLITRDLLPLGSPGVMDLLYALDDRVQQGVLDPASVAPVARYLGVDTIWVPNDIAFERFRTPHPSVINALLTSQPKGLAAPVSYGTPTVNTPVIAMVDEHTLTDGGDATALAPVQLVKVTDPQSIVRAGSKVVLLVGSGDGVVDASAAGLLDGSEALRYAADPATGGTPVLAILTDSNRDRAHHWRSSQDVTGFTEVGGSGSDVLHPDEADQRLPVFGTDPVAADQTVATLADGLRVQASGYGEPFAYRPEQRPAMAVDGDPDTAWVVGDRADPVGEFLTVSSASGSLTLLQAEHTNAATVPNRMITRIHLASGDGKSSDAVLDGRSLVGAGQRVAIHGSGSLTITITAVAVRPGGTDSGPSGVGFAEIGIGAHQEIVRTPELPSSVTAATPLDIVLTRLRVDPMNRWRSDPEPSLVRSFTTIGDRTFEGTVTLQLDARATDATIAAVRPQGTAVTLASARLTGDLHSLGAYATDGDPSTAWTSPFGTAVGDTLTIPTNGSAPGTLRLQQPTDALHSRITRVRLDANGHHVDLAVPNPDANGVSILQVPSAVRGTRTVLTVLATDRRTTVDRRYGETVQLPVSIRELTSPAITVTPAQQPWEGAATCSTGLVTIDGKDVPVSVDSSMMNALLDGTTVTAALCHPLPLTAGTHLLTTNKGFDTGIDVNRVTLTSGKVAPDTAEPTVTATRTLTTRTATVTSCPNGCWVVLGEGLNSQWTATVDGQSLGAPQQIDGGFNGWWLPPSTSTRVVHMEWQAQDRVDFALVLSALLVLLCLVLVWSPRLSRTAVHAHAITVGRGFQGESPVLSRTTWGRRSWGVSIAAGVAIVALTALVASPSTAALAIVPAAVVVAFRRPRLAGVGAALLLAALGARVLERQLVGRFPANAAWPGIFEKLHRPGMMVIVLLAVAVVAEWADDRSGAGGGVVDGAAVEVPDAELHEGSLDHEV